MTQHCLHEHPHEPKSVRITISRAFTLCQPSHPLLLSFFLQPILLFPHPPNPSLNFWLSRTSQRQGHLTAVAVETENWGIFPSPFFLVLQGREEWGGLGWLSRMEGGRNMKVWQRLRKDTTGSHFGWNEIENNFISSTTVTKSHSKAPQWASGSNSIYLHCMLI